MKSPALIAALLCLPLACVSGPTAASRAEQTPPPATQPAKQSVIDQDVATILTKLVVAVQADVEATNKLIEINATKNVTYSSDVWLGREVVLLVALLLGYGFYLRSKRSRDHGSQGIQGAGCGTQG